MLQVPIRQNQECGIHKATDELAVCSEPDAIYEIQAELKINDDDPRQIIKEAKNKTGCSTEKCVVETVLKKGSYSKFIERLSVFGVSGPANSNQWLSDKNIDNTLQQLSKVFDYYHIKYHMINFAEYSSKELNRLTYDYLLKLKNSGIKYVGCVLNTDRYGNGGIHWFCIFIDLTGDCFIIEHFDSCSGPIKKEICALYKQLPPDKVQLTNVTSNIVHQKTNSECGVYSIWYIYARLHGVSADAFSIPGNRVTDESMNAFRKFLFIDNGK